MRLTPLEGSYYSSTRSLGGAVDVVMLCLSPEPQNTNWDGGGRRGVKPKSTCGHLCYMLGASSMEIYDRLCFDNERGWGGAPRSGRGHLEFEFRDLS